jgi:ligand-binding sensor domain-containing protein
MVGGQGMITGFLLVLAATTGRVTEWHHQTHYGGVSTLLVQGTSVLAGTSGGLGFGELTGGAVRFDSVWTYPGRLSHDNVRDLEYDAGGNIWIGYKGGGIDLLLTDGTIQHFGQLEGLPVNLEINCILPDTSVFAGTTQGLSIREYGYFQTWTVSGTGGGLPGDNVTCLAAMDSGLVVGTTSGLAMLRTDQPPGSSSSWYEFPGMTDVNVTSLDHSGDTLWASTTTSLYFLVPDSAWREMTSFPGTSPLCVEMGPGGLAVGCTHEVWVWDGSTWNASTGLYGDRILDIVWLEADRMVIGVCAEVSVERLAGRGVGVGFGSSWSLTQPEGTITNDLMSVSVGDDGLLWVTGNQRGAGVLHDGSWLRISSELPNQSQLFASGAVDDDCYIAPYYYGLTWVRFDPQNGQVTDYHTFDTGNSSILNNQVLDIEFWDEGTIWLALEPFWDPGTEPSGVNLLTWEPGDPSTALWRSFQPVNGLPSGTVNAVAPVSAETAWAGTGNGLAKIDIVATRLLQVLDSSDGLPSSDVQSLAMMRNGDLYIGTTAGLALLEKETGTVSGIEEVDGNIAALCADNLGSVWAANGTALYRRLPGGTVEEYNIYNCPLLSMDIRGMSCDWSGGLLYLATDDGLWELVLEEGLSDSPHGPVVYPNPFLPGTGQVLGIAGVPDLPTTFRVFDLTGTLLYESESPDRDAVAWDGVDSDGYRVASGTYYVQVVQGGTSHILKLAVVR